MSIGLLRLRKEGEWSLTSSSSPVSSSFEGSTPSTTDSPAPDSRFRLRVLDAFVLVVTAPDFVLGSVAAPSLALPFTPAGCLVHGEEWSLASFLVVASLPMDSFVLGFAFCLPLLIGLLHPSMSSLIVFSEE